MSAAVETANPKSSAPKSSLPQCHTCRKRRIRCDATKPSCKKCTSKGLECLGYGSQKPLVWLQGGGTQNQYLGEHSSERKTRKKGRPKLLVASSDDKSTSSSDDEKQWAVTKSKEPKYIGTPIPPDIAIMYPPDMKLIVRSLWYFDQFMYPDLDPILYRPKVHAVDPTAWQDDLSHLFWQLMIVVAGAHKAVRTQDISQVEFSKEIYQYKDRAFRTLSQDLVNPKTRLRDETLLCVLTLFMTEMQQSVEWWSHFEGARKMIDLRGGLGALYSQAPGFKSIFAYFMLTDIMSATTTAALPIPEAMRQLEYRELIPNLYQNGSETCVLCPNKLLDCVIRVNHLRGIRRHSEETTPETDKQAVQDILQDILSFQVSVWADEMNSNYLKAASGNLLSEPRPGFIRPTREDWVLIASVYNAAVILYCIRSLALNCLETVLKVPCLMERSLSTVSYVTIEEIQTVARQILYERLRSLTSPGANGKQPLEKVLAWPIFVAGVEAAVSPEFTSDRTLVADVLHDLSQSLGTLTLRDAKVFLCGLWNRIPTENFGEPVQYWWEDIFGLVKKRCAFFM